MAQGLPRRSRCLLPTSKSLSSFQIAPHGDAEAHPEPSIHPQPAGSCGCRCNFTTARTCSPRAERRGCSSRTGPNCAWCQAILFFLRPHSRCDHDIYLYQHRPAEHRNSLTSAGHIHRIGEHSNHHDHLLGCGPDIHKQINNSRIYNDRDQ